jgi:hypothetical protein
VVSAMPEVLDELKDAVEQDFLEFSQSITSAA